MAEELRKIKNKHTIDSALIRCGYNDAHTQEMMEAEFEFIEQEITEAQVYDVFRLWKFSVDPHTRSLYENFVDPRSSPSYVPPTVYYDTARNAYDGSSEKHRKETARMKSCSSEPCSAVDDKPL
jgi:hypothetical protein